MEELILNLHNHTTYSDGRGSHADIGQAALASGVDIVIVTDHNIWAGHQEKIIRQGSRSVLMLIGEEIHDQARDPQKSHLLVIGAGKELATYAPDPQNLINQVQTAGGMSFIAHPYEVALALFNEDSISWEDWQVNGFTGIEIWNGFSEIKEVIHGRLSAAFYAFFPQAIARGPSPKTLKKWDELLSAGNRIVAVGGSDAHQWNGHMGPLQRMIFPYAFHFRCINNHLLTPEPLSGDLPQDRRMVLHALRQGASFVGYDLPHSTRGFRFTARGRDQIAQIGDEIALDQGLTLQIRLPIPVECRLIHDGKIIRLWRGRETCIHTINQSGAYRVECYINYLGRKRGWIYSNPIYVYDRK